MRPDTPLQHAAPPGPPLWPLAALAAALPCAAALVAWGIATAQGLIPACLPFVDGCTSISRAGRHGLANHVFRTLMMPAAVVQIMAWWVVAQWLRRMAPPAQPLRGLAWILPLGLVAGVALIVYTAFLGVDGPAYRFLRRYGTVAYFGFTCLNLLIAGGAIERSCDAGRLHLAAWQRRAFVVLAVTLVALGLCNAVLAAWLGEPAKDRVENLTEWWGALIFVLAFAALAAMWWREGLRWQLLSARQR